MNQSNRTIEEIAREFLEFLECLEKYGSNYFRAIYFYLEVYYGNRDNLIKELSADKLASFKNKQQERIVSDEIIKDLMLAKQYAFSSNSNKKLQYRCKVFIKIVPVSEDFKIEAVTTVDCISNKYLKLSDEDYKGYLLDIATDKISEEYPLDKIQEYGIVYSLAEVEAL